MLHKKEKDDRTTCYILIPSRVFANICRKKIVLQHEHIHQQLSIMSQEIWKSDIKVLGQ
jgi:3-phenylpropionate/cinnamic acid dioxygenase small subunit